MRITPFKYYCDVLFMTLKEEKSYDRIPNFTVSHFDSDISVGCHIVAYHIECVNRICYHKAPHGIVQKYYILSVVVCDSGNIASCEGIGQATPLERSSQ